MQNYNGTNPVTILPIPTTNGYGIWPTPVEAQDGDKRSGANLMTVSENLTDRTNWCGWRSSLLNVVEGSDSSGRGFFGSTITTDNPWIYKGTVTLDNGLIVGGANTVSISRPTTFSGAGTTEFAANATFDSGFSATFDGKAVFTDNVSPSANPGGDNILSGGNIAKAWAVLTFSGSSTVSISDNYNVASVTLPPDGLHAVVNFARPMASANVAVAYDFMTLASTHRASMARTTAKTASDVTFGVWQDFTSDDPDINLNSSVIQITVIVFARQ